MSSSRKRLSRHHDAIANGAAITSKTGQRRPGIVTHSGQMQARPDRHNLKYLKILKPENNCITTAA
jgi:hypothetical protein